jgi:hypothetical protein
MSATDEMVEAAYGAAKTAMPHEALLEIGAGELDRVVRAALTAALAVAPKPRVRAKIAGLEEGFRIATDALDGLSYIHDGNPSYAMADVPPVEYARHMLYEARMVAREAATSARAALTGGEDQS